LKVIADRFAEEETTIVGLEAASRGITYEKESINAKETVSHEGNRCDHGMGTDVIGWVQTGNVIG